VRVERHVLHHRIKFLRCRSYKIDLTRQALPRSDYSGKPLGLDLAPFRISKTLEDDVGCILKRDRPVEIDENTNP
jgi:hypothetical protein